MFSLKDLNYIKFKRLNHIFFFYLDRNINRFRSINLTLVAFMYCFKPSNQNYLITIKLKYRSNLRTTYKNI